MEQRKKILAVINPISGYGNKWDIHAVLTDNIDSSRFELEIAVTERAGHASELAQKAIANKYYGVLAVGGDGTVNEIAATLINTDVCLGIIPRGSGNGLARHIGIPIDASNAIAVINEDNPRNFDYCTANDRPFFCTCGVGFDAAVSERFAESKKRGPITYLKNTIAEFFKYHCEEYQISANGNTIKEKAFVIACCNASQYGNNAYIAPNASMHDGLIDVTIIHPFTPIDTPILGFLLFTKHIDIDTNIQCLRASEIIIERDAPGIMHIDGEPVNMDKRIEIKCLRDGLKIFTPQNPEQYRGKRPPIENNFREFVAAIRHELNI